MNGAASPGRHHGRYYAVTTTRSFRFAAAGMVVAAFMFAAPAQAASISPSFDVCAALRNGTSLGTIEASLEARGYSASNAGTLTGITIRQQCPNQAAKVMRQVQRPGA